MSNKEESELRLAILKQRLEMRTESYSDLEDLIIQCKKIENWVIPKP